MTGQPDETRSETRSVDDARELARAHWEGGECDGCHISYVLALLADLAAARTEVTRLGRDLDEAEGLLRDWLVWGKAIADALGLNYDTDQERDERMIADAMRMRAAIDEAVRMCNGPGSAQSEASQVKKRVGGVLAAALGGVPPEEAKP